MSSLREWTRPGKARAFFFCHRIGVYLCNMPLQRFTFNPLQENTYLIWCERTNDCVLIDAGMYNRSEQSQIQNFLIEKELNPVALWGTHAHIDHIFGNDWFLKTYGVPYYLHPADLPMIERSKSMAAVWDLQYTESPLPTHHLEHGQTLQVGQCQWEVRFVPGHAPGHVAFINHSDQTALVGDTIFYGSIGRTDLPGGNHQELLSAIERELFSIPDSYTLFPGHGPETTVGQEKTSNPFFDHLRA